MPCQGRTQFGWGTSIDLLYSSAIETWDCSWDFNRNYSLNMLALPLKSGFNFPSAAWPLVPLCTSGTSQNINIMRNTQTCFNAGCKISQLSYEDAIILIMAAYEFECFLVLPVFFFILHRREIKERLCVCVWECVYITTETRCHLPEPRCPGSHECRMQASWCRASIWSFYSQCAFVCVCVRVCLCTFVCVCVWVKVTLPAFQGSV